MIHDLWDYWLVPFVFFSALGVIVWGSHEHERAVNKPHFSTVAEMRLNSTPAFEPRHIANHTFEAFAGPSLAKLMEHLK